jgi:hypothetical protein
MHLAISFALMHFRVADHEIGSGWILSLSDSVVFGNTSYRDANVGPNSRNREKARIRSQTFRNVQEERSRRHKDDVICQFFWEAKWRKE